MRGSWLVYRSNSSGESTSVDLPLSSSLPTAVGMRLADDIIAIGKRNLSPYRLAKPQLDDLALLIEAEGDIAAKNILMNDRQTILNRIADGVVSGRANELARETYFVEGRKTVEGLCREIGERVKQAGGETTSRELQAVITTANAGDVLMRLQVALQELDCPTEAISPQS